MEAAMRAWERGLSSVPDKVVCAAHIDDYAVRLFVKRNGEQGRCDYCKRNKLVIPLETLMEFLTDALVHFYTDPANFMTYISSEGGYVGDFDGPWEMLTELGLEIDNDELNDDVHDSLDHSSAWANEGNSSDYRYEGWMHFRHVVKHESRFLFRRREDFRVGSRVISVSQFLMELSADIRRQRMLTNIAAGTSLFRCRQHVNVNEISSISQICSPEIKFVRYPNRMSPAGISMFYCSFDPDIAFKETISSEDLTRPFYTMAEFQTLDDLYLIDLSKIPYVSAFDQEKWELFDRTDFLTRFLHDFSAPILHDGREHVDYVPTQIITEYFRFEFARAGSRQIDGIIYPSSKNRKKNACVLFMDHYQSKSRLQLDPLNIICKSVL